MPGRTVTLQPAPELRTWGVAYRLPEDVEDRRLALQELEWREKQYDKKLYVTVFHGDGSVAVANALVYVGSADRSKNVNYGGPLPLEDLAQQISAAVGPSGPNNEYLFGLADGLRRIGAEDDHVFALEALVRKLPGQ
jgi:cation transport regulator ChaC